MAKEVKTPFLSKDEVKKIQRNMRDKDQVFIFNNAEIGLIKAIFTDNDDLLYIIRKVLLQFDLTSDESSTLRSSLTPELLSILKKRIFPDWSDEYPLTQMPNMLAGLTTDIRQRKVEDMALLFDAKQLEIDYLAQQFDVLQGKKEGKIKLAEMASLEGKDLNQRFVDITAYLWLMGHIDPMLVYLKNIAGQKTESVEQAKDRMKKDSSK